MTVAVVPQERPTMQALSEVEQARILQALSLDIRNPLTQALLLVSQRYDLDPILKQVQIIKGNVYITHAGLLHIAHASGKLDGIEVLEETSDSTHFRAKVSVYRKDMSKPFTYSGEYAKSKVRSDGASGREMALKNAERSALRRAFDVTAPTMDDSGQDFDDVPPGTDIDLPPGKPALPTAAAPLNMPEEDKPTPAPKAATATRSKPTATAASGAQPAAIAPTTPESGANGASADTSSPKPTTAELPKSSAGHPINPVTGGEMLLPNGHRPLSDEEASALAAHQARAREIAEEAEAKLAEAVPATATPRPVKKTAVARKAPAKPKEKEYPPEVIERAQQLHMVAKQQDIEETLLRDVVLAITDQRTSSTREVDQGEYDLIRAVLVAIGTNIIDLEYDEEGRLVLDMMENPLPPDDADPNEGVEVVEAEVVRDWKQEATVRNIKDGMFLRKARALAEELGVPMPSSFKDITGPELERALWEWVQEYPPHS